MTRSLCKLVAAGLLAGALACSKDTTGPVAGTLKVKLTVTPNSGLDGAALFSVTGPAVPSAVGVGSGFRLFGTATGTTSTFAVTGTLSTNSVVMTLTVDDINKVSQYSATMLSVAALSTFTVRPPSGYTLRVTM